MFFQPEKLTLGYRDEALWSRLNRLVEEGKKGYITVTLHPEDILLQINKDHIISYRSDFDNLVIIKCTVGEYKVKDTKRLIEIKIGATTC